MFHRILDKLWRKLTGAPFAGGQAFDIEEVSDNVPSFPLDPDKQDREEMDALLAKRDDLRHQLEEVENEIIALAQLMRLSR